MCDTVLTLPKPWCQGQIEGLKDKLNIKAASLKEEKIKWGKIKKMEKWK